MNDLIAQAKAAAAKLKDQTDETGGGDFEYVPPAAGKCIGRFVTYIEVGKHPQKPYQGTPKPPAYEAIVEFELLGKKHAKEIEVTENGATRKKTVYPIIRQIVTLKGGAKSASYKLTKSLDYGRGNTHMAFMLGEAFMINVIHNTVEKDGKSVTYANIKDENGVWQIGAPVVQKFDEESGEPIGEPTPVKAPPATVELKMLLWDAPSIEQWNSIHVPGEYTKKVDNKEVSFSKNYYQMKAMESLDWEGSAIQSVVAALGGDLPDMGLDPDEMDEKPPVADDPGKGSQKSEKAPVAPPSESDDPLADLGLDD